MVWTCAEEGQGICWQKDDQDGATRQEAKPKTEEEIHGCDERGLADSWCEKRRCRGEGEIEGDDLLWRLLQIPK